MTTEADLFASCETLDEIMFLVLQEAGVEGLNGLLTELVDTGATDQQSLLEAADELVAVGLTDAAKLVADRARQAPIVRFWKSRQQQQAEIEANGRYWGGRVC